MARKRPALGRGLDALIPDKLEENAANGAQNIPITDISPNPRQPRVQFKPDELAELAASIREHGIIQPLIVTLAPDGKFTLIAGERRLQAAKLAGLEAVPALVREASAQQMLELALIENIQRSDLNSLEAAKAYRQLSEEFHLSHEEIAQRVGKSREAVSNTMRLLKLIPQVQTALAEGRISEGHARAILRRDTTQGQLAALDVILKKGLSVRQTEELMRKLSGEKPKAAPKPIALPEITALQEQLESALETKVRLKHGKHGGAVTIYYQSDEQLDALIKKLS